MFLQLRPPPLAPAEAPAPRRGSRLGRFWRSLGPGLITGASDDDPSGIATYSQAGAAFGLATLWTALLTFPLMAAMQEMCARIGLVTQRGLAGTLRQHYPRWVLYGLLGFTFPAIVLNIGADLQGMGAVMHLLVPAVPTLAFSVLFTGLLLLAIVFYPYQRLVGILKWLCAVLLLYLVVPFLVRQDWGAVARHTFWPSVQLNRPFAALLVAIVFYPYQRLVGILKWLCAVLLLYLVVPFLVRQDWAAVARHTLWPTFQLNKPFAAILVAILGTTISPYLFFWQAEMEAEEMRHLSTAGGHGHRIVVDKPRLRTMQTDVSVGMFVSNLIMFFIILTTGVVLFPAGIRQIDTVEQAAQALRPLAGEAAYLLFAAGVVGTGLLAIPVLAGALAYAMAQTFRWRGGLDRRLRQAPAFYATIFASLGVGVLLDTLGISPIQALLYTAILYGLTAPVMIVLVLHLANNKAVMGEFTNGRVSNMLGLLTLVLMSAAAGLLLYFQFVA